MNIIVRLTVLAAGCVTFCQCDACVDKLPDCGEYTKSSCKAPYVNWAYNNCKAYCGFCHTECHDKRSDCHEYGKQVCQSPYIPWAKENCEQYCGFCGHDLKCVYSPWLDLTPCSPVCGRGKKVQVPVTETLIVTDKTHVQEPVVDTGVLDHHGPLIHVDPDTVKDVAIAGAATGVAAAGGVALGTLFAELLPMLPLFAFGKRYVTEQTRDFEDFVNTVMKAQDF
uniref:ShKT domain-containing protein n=1 Tax=Magallana gigas TaxID=29159 RepID=A0A8W8MHU1_MAGGI